MSPRPLLASALALSLCLAGIAPARQNQLARQDDVVQGARQRSRQRPAEELRDGGTYRYDPARGAWSRTRGDVYGAGTEAIYRNDAAPSYFTVLADGVPITDQGRIPGTGSEGDFDAYIVDSFQFAYCTGQDQLLDAAISFQAAYVPCTSPQGTPLAQLGLGGLPAGGSSAGVACWLITVDLAGTTQAFSFPADGGDGYQADPALDSFGLTLSISGHGADPLTGPIQAGDPLNAPHGAGTRAAWGFPAGPGTGLGQADQFWIDPGPGCVTGSYPLSRFNGVFAVLEGRPDDGNLLTSYTCPATPNSTGSVARLVATGSTSMADGNFVLRAGPVAPLQPGLFYYGPNQIQLPLGNGVRCVGGVVVRLPIVAEVGGFLENEVSAELVAFGAVGSTIHLQAWYRDAPAGGFAFDLSDAGLVTILP